MEKYYAVLLWRSTVKCCCGELLWSIIIVEKYCEVLLRRIIVKNYHCGEVLLCEKH